MKMRMRRSYKRAKKTSRKKMGWREVSEAGYIYRKASHHRWICWMDPHITSGVCDEAGAAAVSPPTLLYTREERGTPNDRDPTGLGWTPWSGEARKTGTTGAPPKPPH